MGEAGDQDNAHAFYTAARRIRDAAAAEIARLKDEGKQTTESGDAVEECLTGQPLDFYLFLRDRRHWTKYDTLRAQAKFWRKPDPDDETIHRALRRLREELTAIESSRVALIIDHKHRRAKLDK
jgi:hypothetical protein